MRSFAKLCWSACHAIEYNASRYLLACLVYFLLDFCNVKPSHSLLPFSCTLEYKHANVMVDCHRLRRDQSADALTKTQNMDQQEIVKLTHELQVRKNTHDPIWLSWVFVFRNFLKRRRSLFEKDDYKLYILFFGLQNYV